MDTESLPPLTRAARALGLIGVEALSIGLAVWIALSREILPAYVRDNELMPGQRKIVLIDMAVAVAVAGVIALAIFVWKRRAGLPVLPVLERLARRASPVLVLWLVFLVFDRRLWDDRDWLVLPLVLGLGWGLVATLRTAWNTEPAFPGLARRVVAQGERGWARIVPAFGLLAKPAAPLVFVTVCAAAYAVYFSIFTIRNHHHLGTHGFDLAIFDNLLWHVIHPEIPLFRSTPSSGPSPDATHFGHHATFFAYAIAPIYAIARGPETLLVVQATMLGGAAIPLYLYAKSHLPRWTAALVACAYLVYPPLHGANLYDFHDLTIGVFFPWVLLYAVEANRRALAIVACVLALSVREDMGAIVAVLGLFLLLTGASARAGALLTGVGGVYFVLMKMVLMPRLGHMDASFINQYQGLLPSDESGFGGVLKTVVANPAFTANVVLEREKVTYCLQIFAPLLLLPLTRPIGILLAVPGAVFTLLSTGYWPLYQPSFQYTTYWTIFLFIGVVVALEHAGRVRHEGDLGALVRRRTLVAGFVVASLAGTYLDGAILSRDNVRSGFIHAHFTTTPEDRQSQADLDALVRQIPPDDKVAASDRLLPHVSTRDDAYTLGHGTFDADWVLFEVDMSGDERKNLVDALLDGSFGVVDERGRLALAKRGAPQGGSFDVLKRFTP